MNNKDKEWWYVSRQAYVNREIEQGKGVETQVAVHWGSATGAQRWRLWRVSHVGAHEESSKEKEQPVQKP